MLLLVDFVNSLKKDNTKLTILGNGKQYKSYFHVDDCINALILLFKKLESNAIKGFFPINLGTEDGITVEDSAKIICETLVYLLLHRVSSLWFKVLLPSVKVRIFVR